MKLSCSVTRVTFTLGGDMSTIDRLKSAIDHLERMEYNKTHFYAMAAACRPALRDKMDKHLQHAIESAQQDVRNIAAIANELLKEI